jgi:hypothetical protein
MLAEGDNVSKNRNKGKKNSDEYAKNNNGYGKSSNSNSANGNVTLLFFRFLSLKWEDMHLFI